MASVQLDLKQTSFQPPIKNQLIQIFILFTTLILHNIACKNLVCCIKPKTFKERGHSFIL
jgi:hypothetical protein